MEHRTPAAGPTVIDTVANAAFYYGLAQNLCEHIINAGLPMSFAQAKDNFYQAAQHGLDSVIVWRDGNKHRLDALISNELLPRAEAGLRSIDIDPADIAHYLGIIRERLKRKQTGSRWQCRFFKEYNADFEDMTRHYLNNQIQGNPVSQWSYK